MAKKFINKTESSARAASFDEVVQQKVAAGLTRQQAEGVTRRQFASDGIPLAGPDDSGAEETTTAMA